MSEDQPVTSSGSGHPDDFSVGGFVAGQLASALSNMRRAGQEIRLATRNIRAARERFWATYPNGEGHAAAADAFARELRGKDLYFLISRNTQMFAGGPTALDLTEKLTGGTLDGGIPEAAREAFDEWVIVVRSAAPKVMGMPMIGAGAVDTPEGDEAYRAYVLLRDYEECVNRPR